MASRRWIGAGVLLGAVCVIGSARLASAGIEKGTCTGSGSFQQGGLTIDATTAGDQLFTVPRSDSVAWTGSVAGPPGTYSGSISVDLPPPFGTVTIDSWKGDSQTTSNSGIEKYDLPKLVPAGVEFRVVGNHTDANGVCSGYVRLQIDGGPFDSPITPISLAMTAITGGGFAAALWPLFRRVV
jgi:hypothetical protein